MCIRDRGDPVEVLLGRLDIGDVRDDRVRRRQLVGAIGPVSYTHLDVYKRQVAGLLGALWSASGYVNAFGRAMNRVYEIDEGRPIWKLRPLFLACLLYTSRCV